MCVALYLTVLFIESTPAALEWLGWKKLRRVVGSMTIGLTVFGLILSTIFALVSMVKYQLDDLEQTITTEAASERRQRAY